MGVLGGVRGLVALLLSLEAICNIYGCGGTRAKERTAATGSAQVVDAVKRVRTA
jgi:hypothetical protein